MANYGYCPICGRRGVSKERRMNGNDTCENGHMYPSHTATPAPISFSSRRTITITLECRPKDSLSRADRRFAAEQLREMADEIEHMPDPSREMLAKAPDCGARLCNTRSFAPAEALSAKESA